MGCGISSTLDGLKQNSPSTKSVYLEGRALGPKGGRDLADAIAMNTSCLKMNLTGCLLGDEGASALFEAFETNTSCLELLVGGNDIKAAGARAAAAMLEKNTTLLVLNLDANKIDEEGLKAIADALKKNCTLTTLILKTGAQWGCTYKDGKIIASTESPALSAFATAIADTTGLIELDFTGLCPGGLIEALVVVVWCPWRITLLENYPTCRYSTGDVSATITQAATARGDEYVKMITEACVANVANGGKLQKVKFGKRPKLCGDGRAEAVEWTRGQDAVPIP